MSLQKELLLQCINWNFPEVNLYRDTITDERKNLQRKVASESQILLKNDGILPLKNIKKIIVVGNDSLERYCGIGRIIL